MSLDVNNNFSLIQSIVSSYSGSSPGQHALLKINFKVWGKLQYIWYNLKIISLGLWLNGQLIEWNNLLALNNEDNCINETISTFDCWTTKALSNCTNCFQNFTSLLLIGIYLSIWFLDRLFYTKISYWVLKFL